MIKFEDFSGRSEGKFFIAHNERQAMVETNKWIDDNSVRVISVETIMRGGTFFVVSESGVWTFKLIYHKANAENDAWKECINLFWERGINVSREQNQYQKKIEVFVLCYDLLKQFMILISLIFISVLIFWVDKVSLFFLISVVFIPSLVWLVFRAFELKLTMWYVERIAQSAEQEEKRRGRGYE